MKEAKYGLCCVLMLISFLLSGCQNSPEQAAVLGKNDGSFDALAASSAEEEHNPNETQEVQYSDCFFSTDDSVEFRFSIEEIFPLKDMPIIEVEPHMLTEEDVQRVAYALFGEQDYYELNSFLDPEFSKDELQERISRWAQYSNDSALRELYGNQPYDKELIQTFIERYTQEMENALDESTKELTQWEFRNGSVYWNSAGKNRKLNPEAYNDEIRLTIKTNGVQYLFSAATRDTATSKLNNITAFPFSEISPGDIDNHIFYAILCRTGAPTQEQIEHAKHLAEQALQQMELGDWVVDQCYVGSNFYQKENEYVIHVNAVPAFSGVPAARQDQFSGLSNNETEYAFNYYLTNVHFEYTADGKLANFELDSPVDIVENINSNVQTMELEALIDRAKEHLKLSDYYEYGLGGVLDSIKEREDLTCIVTIDELGYDLIRVKVPNSNDSYYYVPGVVFSGTVEYYGKESGELYYVYRDSSKEHEDHKTLLVLNAVDGTILRTGTS